MKIKLLLEAMKNAAKNVEKWEKWLYIPRGFQAVFSNDYNTRIYLNYNPKNSWMMFAKTVRISAVAANEEKIREELSKLAERFKFEIVDIKVFNQIFDTQEFVIRFQFLTRLENDIEWFNEQYRQANDHIGRIYKTVKDNSDTVYTRIMSSSVGMKFPFLGQEEMYHNYGHLIFSDEHSGDHLTVKD